MFSLFPQLPAELQLKIWDASLPSPGIHIFDVCFQGLSSTDKETSGEVADDGAHAEHTFLRSLTVTPANCRGAAATTFGSDPSAYRIANTLSATNSDSSVVVKSRLRNDKSGRLNFVHMPSQKKRVPYDNKTDVLCLRFGSGDGVGQTEPLFRNSISSLLEAEWSEDMAASLFSARRLAIDIAEMWSGLDAMSIAYLCCCIQNDLEVLYLVDYCVGRCQRCFKGSLTSKELTASTCGLGRELEPEDREMDVVYGSTVAYREISDLGKLGWNNDHSAFTLAQLMGDAIREQQGAEGPFQSVRILVCEEEVAGTIRARCIEGS